MHSTTSSNVRNGKLPIRTFFVFTIILLLSVSATWWVTRNYYDNSLANDRAFLRLDSSLKIANKFLINACLEDSMYVDLKSRTPGYQKIQIIYKPKIDSVMLLARGMHTYIQELKLSLNLNLNVEEDKELANNSQSTKNGKLNSNEVTKSLYDSLNSYSKSLLNILPFKIKYYNLNMPVDTSKSFFKNAEIWKNAYFDGLTRLATLSSLTELDYKVWLSANQMTNIICSQWSDDLQLDDRYRYFLTNQNSSYFLPGQTLEINVGLGSYVKNIKPQIFIDGQEQAVNAEGYTIFKKPITSRKSGLIPITISYKDPNTGQTKTMSKQLSYTVLQPSKK